ncbi:MAG: FAD:protein FMN transferase [Bryobacteraceae bacterium]
MAELSRRRVFLAIAGTLAILAALELAQSKRGPDPGSLRVTRTLMGTLWKVEVMHGGRVEAANHAMTGVWAELERIDRLMSEWKPDSPVSAINAAAGTWVDHVPGELRALLERGTAYSEKSSGAFDVTWKGMGGLWHFDDRFRIPSAADVQRAIGNVDYRALQIDGNRVRLTGPGMAIGLGGIAKGYAIDRAAAVLTRAGFTNYLVDGGGDIYVSGMRGDNPWRLGLQDPRGERGSLIGAIPLSGKALVTSGDYERFRIVDGVRFHHIIDPRTGWPATRSRSVSVVAGTAEQADALATAIFVLGPEQGLALAKAESVDVLIIDAQGKRHLTAGFAAIFETL